MEDAENKERNQENYTNTTQIPTLSNEAKHEITLDSPQEISDSESAYIDELNFLEGRQVGKYRVTKSLGSGASCRVKLGISLENGEKVAIKIVNRAQTKTLSREEKDKRESRIYREVLISSLMCHPHIVRLKNFYFNENYFYLVFEYVKGFQLLDIILEHGPLKEKDARRYFRQILSAVSYIHENNIVHRDLKIENVLIDEHGNVKLLDFGLSNFYDPRRFLYTFCGSLYFAAPELLLGRRYMGPEIDVWSLGIVLYVMLQGKVPFDDRNVHSLHQKIKAAKIVYFKKVSDDAKALLNGMIVAPSIKRFGLDQVIKSKWVNKKYKTMVDNFLLPRFPLNEVDEHLVRILALITKEQFPHLKNELLKYMEACKDNKNKVEKDYWMMRPSISLYFLLVENFDSEILKTTQKGFVSESKNCAKETLEEKPENMHNFVNFLFAKEKENSFSKYFLGNIFNEDTSSPFYADQSLSLKEEFDADEAIKRIESIEKPKLKRSFVKGIFTGIFMNNMSCHEKLRQVIQDCMIDKRIIFEIRDRHYMCSYGNEEISVTFKVSLYFNRILDRYYLSVTKMGGDKREFKKVYKIFLEVGKGNRRIEKI